MDPVKRILERLSGARKSEDGDQWYALCPAHEDATASFSLARGEKGNALVKCHRGCNLDAILVALGMTKGDLFPEANGSGKWDAVAHYHYADENGILLYTKTRWCLPDGKKQYSYKQPDGTKSIKGLRRIPYRLDALVKLDPENGIAVAEGEKCCDALRRIGIAATTNPNGASKGRSKWKELETDTVTKLFTGRDVVILPDNDEPGKFHAQEVARSLFPIAKSVSIIEIPGLAEAGDVADWIEEREAAGKKPEEIKTELQALIDPVMPISEAPPAREPRNPGRKTPSIDGVTAVHRTDLGNARRLRALHGESLRYCHPWRKWLAWDGRRWEEDATARVLRFARHVVAEIIREAAALEGEDREDLVKWALSSESERRLQ